MKKRIFRTVLAGSFLMIVGTILAVSIGMYQVYSADQKEQLEEELELAVCGVEALGVSYLDSLPDSALRFTLVPPDGRVTSDTARPVALLENHMEREEIQEALAFGTGRAIRDSSTMLERTVYLAKRLPNGEVLRIAAKAPTYFSTLFSLLPLIVLLSVIGVLLAFVLASFTSKRSVEPLNEMDLENPSIEQLDEELVPLGRRIQEQRNRIDVQMRQLQERTDELAQITANLNEGLILLNEDGVMRLINPAAKRIFQCADYDRAGATLVELDRSEQMRRAFKQAERNGKAEFRMERHGRDYEVRISQIAPPGRGAVLLAVDITERVQAELERRAFSANVSHELKTPLQAISGSAEMLEQGIVRPEDTGLFIERIRKEANRMENLVSDILHLSALDEGMDLEKETVDLFCLAQECLESLAPLAEERDIQLEADGSHVKIFGVKTLLEEIIHNLCHNAVRYNIPHGRVNAHVGEEVGSAFVRVQDTGIGIPAEYAERIFERFFRVDQSRSKETGGTGLGLSIVKHAAALHNAHIDVESDTRGTCMTVWFPSLIR